jgi:hypothetical protein
LLQVPAGYKKMVRAIVEGTRTKDILLFTPKLTEPDLAMEDGAFQLGDGKGLTIIMENHGKKECNWGMYSQLLRRMLQMPWGVGPSTGLPLTSRKELLSQLDLQLGPIGSEE